MTREPLFINANNNGYSYGSIGENDFTGELEEEEE